MAPQGILRIWLALAAAILLHVAAPLTAAQPALAPADTVTTLRGRAATVLTATALPAGTTVVEWTLAPGVDTAEAPAALHPGGATPPGWLQIRGEGANLIGRIDFARPLDTPYSGALARLEWDVRLATPHRGTIAITAASATLADATVLPATGGSAHLSAVVVRDPILLFTLLAAVVGLIYALSMLRAMAGFFRYLPPLIWMYFVPMFLTTLGIIPDTSPLYSPFMSRTILPAVLVLLLISSDLRGLSRLGLPALVMMAFATGGIIIGSIGAFALFNALMPDSLPPETWKFMASLSASWIGGSPNMFAVIESVETPASLIGPMVIVDTVVAYSWLGLLIAGSSVQDRIDARHGANRTVIDSIAAKLQTEQAAKSQCPRVADIAFMLALAFVVSQLCIWAGGPIHTFLSKTLGLSTIGQVINAFGWAILLLTAVGLALSFTPVRQLEFRGASSIGYVGLYLLLTCYGAQANLTAVLEVPVFFAIAVALLLIHIGMLYIGLRLTRSPLVLAAASSMANIGGTASAPVVAASYNASLAPVGLLLAILGGVLGTPVALFVIGTACRAIAGG